MNLIGLQRWCSGDMQRWQALWAIVMCGDAWQEEGSELGVVCFEWMGEDEGESG